MEARTYTDLHGREPERPCVSVCVRVALALLLLAPAAIAATSDTNAPAPRPTTQRDSYNAGTARLPAALQTQHEQWLSAAG